ncbi:hypothetical protein CGLO_18390 [Colletotrichum gloeosporioides Cg-14]|nr:hypothetical protein CGLO_18390 [Colletotrichum gloeosporioides Cg-14]
MRASKA